MFVRSSEVKHGMLSANITVAPNFIQRRTSPKSHWRLIKCNLKQTVSVTHESRTSHCVRGPSNDKTSCHQVRRERVMSSELGGALACLFWLPGLNASDAFSLWSSALTVRFKLEKRVWKASRICIFSTLCKPQRELVTLEECIFWCNFL